MWIPIIALYAWITSGVVLHIDWWQGLFYVTP